MHELLWKKLEALECGRTAERAGCRYETEKGRFEITMLAVTYIVEPGKKNIFEKGSPPRNANFLEQLCIISYLLNVGDKPLSGKLVRADSLPGGQFFFRGPHGMPTGKLIDAFGERPERLFSAAAGFGGEPRPYGDAAVEILVLPKLPLTLVVWAGDEEFPPRASILFDSTAADNLPLDAIFAAVNLAVDKLTSPKGRCS